ncbi:MAG: c-type cytochrome [Melioribacteraceae bacterium]|nr:c-type cytochrome [Melioribacteraceae bacterium]MCF8264285.1 c-type cytochrome [Melioribacteraceae bacterium]MCF8431050.1 c-type cytochrome [Melioribacteraceae bacterium]
MRKKSLPFYTFILTFLFLQNLSAQNKFSWNNETSNLQVLPDSITPQQLKNTMMMFTAGLGVRCNYCHDDSKGNTLNEINFASDLKETKLVAREMYKMLQSINNDHLAGIQEITGNKGFAGCVTCHHGIPKPKHLSQVIEEEIVNKGIESAVKKYYDLKEQFYGSASYDFTEGQLNFLGYKYLHNGDNKIALELFKLNAETNGKSANAWDSLAEAYLKNGDSEKAIEYYKKSLELNPKNKNAKKMLEEISMGK